ncbi:MITOCHONDRIAL DIVISION PROTEIN 1-RELATED [Salix purpurea]|uniref:MITOCHONDRIAL DIVISION PROTEIN 1-RELATED n=1 Tax=Salix purpurea TaxID=77065 RepID=A0A9Q1AAK9_SALPP|nr:MITOCHONDRIAL DIVISION PROTEIN 1-RELATED [Salix purpurea]
MSGIEWVRWHPKGHLDMKQVLPVVILLLMVKQSVLVRMMHPLRIWNPKSGENIHVVKGHPYHTDGLTCLALSSDSTLAITGSKDNSVHIVNITTSRVVTSLVSHSDSVECVGLAPSSPWAATGGLDQKLIIWDLQHSLPRASCEHKDGVTCLAWLGASRYVATGCVDGKVRLWDCLSGDCVRILSGHTDAIQSLSVSAHQDYLVSGSSDGTARVFEIAEFK